MLAQTGQSWSVNFMPSGSQQRCLLSSCPRQLARGCAEKVTPLLRTAGHEVYTQLWPVLGEHSHTLSREINLETHITDVVQFMPV